MIEFFMPENARSSRSLSSTWALVLRCGDWNQIFRNYATAIHRQFKVLHLCFTQKARSILVANYQRIKSRFPKETCDISKLKTLNFTRKMNLWIGSVGTKNIELKTWSTDQYCRIHVPSIVEFMLWDLYNSCRNMNYTKLEKNMNYTTGRGFRFLYNSCKF